MDYKHIHKQTRYHNVHTHVKKMLMHALKQCTAQCWQALALNVNVTVVSLISESADAGSLGSTCVFGDGKSRQTVWRKS